MSPASRHSVHVAHSGLQYCKALAVVAGRFQRFPGYVSCTFGEWASAGDVGGHSRYI